MKYQRSSLILSLTTSRGKIDGRPSGNSRYPSLTFRTHRIPMYFERKTDVTDSLCRKNARERRDLLNSVVGWVYHITRETTSFEWRHSNPSDKRASSCGHGLREKSRLRFFACRFHANTNRDDVQSYAVRLW